MLHDHGCADSSLIYYAHFFWKQFQMWHAGLYGSSSFNFLRDLPAALHKGCTKLHSHDQHIGPPFLHILTKFLLSYLDDGHSERCRGGPHCGFDLHLTDG